MHSSSTKTGSVGDSVCHTNTHKISCFHISITTCLVLSNTFQYHMVGINIFKHAHQLAMYVHMAGSRNQWLTHLRPYGNKAKWWMVEGVVHLMLCVRKYSQCTILKNMDTIVSRMPKPMTMKVFLPSISCRGLKWGYKCSVALPWKGWIKKKLKITALARLYSPEHNP